jgi:hypothetical protein
MGWESSVSIVTRYRLDSLGIKFWWGQDFLHQSGLALGPTQPPTMGTGSFLRVERLGCGIDHPPPSIAKVKERVELYLFSTSGSLWPVIFMGTKYISTLYLFASKAIGILFLLGFCFMEAHLEKFCVQCSYVWTP